MPYYEIHADRSSACRRERALKRKKSAAYLRYMIETAYPGMLFKPPAT